MSSEKECYICKTTVGLHRHHVFFGAKNRKLSEKYGCWVYLCQEHHEGKLGPHMHRYTDLAFKMVCQALWEEKYGDRDDFIRVFGRSYL